MSKMREKVHTKNLVTNYNSPWLPSSWSDGSNRHFYSCTYNISCFWVLQCKKLPVLSIIGLWKEGWPSYITGLLKGTALCFPDMLHPLEQGLWTWWHQLCFLEAEDHIIFQGIFKQMLCLKFVQARKPLVPSYFIKRETFDGGVKAPKLETRRHKF